MEEIVSYSKETTFLQKTSRYALIIIGSFLFVTPQYFVEGNNIYLLKTVALFIILPAVANPYLIFGGNVKIILTEKFIKGIDESIHVIGYLLRCFSKQKTTESMTTGRTIYWHRIKKIVLTRFTLRAYNESGNFENFQIPYRNQEEFKKIRSKIIQKSEEHNFRVEEKAWWKKPF
ncbi:MAG: hypothetical protein ACQEST_03830 [Bacteroidota bacterium]